ncbi:hypothetical protein [Saccharopolyspora rosea]|uniref:Glycosyl hydrolase family 39 n=1 Tax=Saccharopolyspora rosea TaxID=524884 RepID=A0ABW3FQV8_9PSEU|nr:hypothetical protein [Saccharopolyspora rosea]
MGRASQPEPAEYTRRRVLASAAGIGAAALLGGCGVGPDSGDAPSASLQVDFGQTAFFPLLKSKIGVGRALESTQILDSVQYLDEIRPALYDAELRFPNASWPSLTPYPIVVGADGQISALPNDFLNELFSGLHQRNVEIMVQLEGAPKQWWDYAKAERPHLFPAPTDLAAAADAIGKWAKLYSGYPISWCVWNEPSHNLTGSPNPASVKQMVDIYDAYTSAIAPQGLFGMASFITPSAVPRKQLGGRTHLEATIDRLRARRKANPDLPFDYLTLNNYGEDLNALLDAARNALGTDFNTVPLIQAQSGVFKPGEWEGNAGTTLEAARSMASLRTALQVPDLQTFTFSGWLPHLIAYRNGKALRLPLFNALKLYARMPDRRTPVRGALPAGLGAMASGDQYRSSILVWNETDQPHSIELQLSNVASQRGAEVSVYRIDSEHGSPLERGGDDFTPIEVAPLSQPLSKTVTVAGPGITYLEIGTASDPDLDRGGLDATLVRKHTYADRIAGPNGTTSVRGNAYGCYDAVRAIAHLGIQGSEGTALCGAEYRDLPNTLGIDIWTDRLAAQPSSPQALFGIRVDYVLAGTAAKSVLWHGDIVDSHRTAPLPWGRGGPTADVVVHAPELDRARAGRVELVLPLAAHAPPGWAQSGRQAIISFWMDSTGPGSQARFLLG